MCDREQRIRELPDALAVAVRLHDAHVCEATIATALGIPPESVPVILRVAEAKLAELDGRRPAP